MTKRLYPAFVLFVVLLTSVRVAKTQSAPAPSGHWEGSIQIPGQELAIEIDLARNGEKWEGTISIPAQGIRALPLSDIAVEADRVSFGMTGVPGSPGFRGTLAQDGKSISGQFTQGGGTIPFALKWTGSAKFEAPPKSTSVAKEFEGSWQGSLDVNGTILRLVVKLVNHQDGVATGSLISVDQGGVEFPITAVVQTGLHLKLVIRPITAAFEGDMKDEQLMGTWTQGALSLPLVFKR